MKKILITALAIAAMGSCAKDSDSSLEATTSKAQEMQFTSGIQSRVVGNEWTENDVIMIDVKDRNTNSLLYKDAPYYATSSGAATSFKSSPNSSTIFYPMEPAFDLEVFAYYPDYKNPQDGEEPLFDISYQWDISYADYMEARTQITEADKGRGVALDFEHKHTLVRFKINVGESLAELPYMNLQLDNIQLRGVAGVPTDPDSKEYALAEFGEIDFEPRSFSSDNKSATAELILFPTASDVTTNSLLYVYYNNKMLFTDFDVVLNPGKIQTYTLRLGSDRIAFEESSIQPWEGASDQSTTLPSTVEDGKMFMDEFLQISQNNLPKANSWIIYGKEADGLSNTYMNTLDRYLAIAKREVSLTFADVESIEAQNLFRQINYINSVSLPKLQVVPEYCFDLNSAVTNLTFESAKKVSAYAFNSCDNLRSLSLPAVEEIGFCALASSENLKELRLATNRGVKLKKFDSLAFYNSPITLEIDLVVGSANANLVDLESSTLTVDDSSFTFKSITIE